MVVNAFANRYAAITYSWGTKEDAEKQLKTAMSTLQQHLSGIEPQNMPQTIADAVELCRAISLRYLWIDALSKVKMMTGRENPLKRQIYTQTTSLLSVLSRGLLARLYFWRGNTIRTRCR